MALEIGCVVNFSWSVFIAYRLLCVYSNRKNKNYRQDFIIAKIYLHKTMTTFGLGKNATEQPTSEPPKDMYVKLISSDDHEFYVKRDLALTSQTIKAMLSGPGKNFI
jgi:hypothetical protein